MLILFSHYKKQGFNSNQTESQGLINIKSDFPPEKTIKRIEQLLKEKEFHIFTHINHSKSAKEHGQELNSTYLIIFGNPKTGGTGLMQENQTIGIDLPAKILVWEDNTKTTYVSYNSIRWIAERHHLSNKNKSVIETLDCAIATVSKKAATKP